MVWVDFFIDIGRGGCNLPEAQRSSPGKLKFEEHYTSSERDRSVYFLNGVTTIKDTMFRNIFLVFLNFV